MNTIKLDSGTVKMIAHRGLSGLEKENTCAAFIAAGNREKYFGIETDVHRTADGRFVVFHDDNTARVGLDSLVVEESTFDTLRRLHLTDLDGTRGRTDLLIPTMDEYIGICKKYEKVCVFELKNEFCEEDICKILDTFQAAEYLSHTIFISFQPNNLVLLRKHSASARIQLLLSQWREEALEAMVRYDWGLDIKYTALTQELVDRVHEAGKEVNCWTVNTLEDGQAMVGLGVDYITTNILE